MKYAVKSTTYGTMRTFDNEHDAVSAMNTYNWATENDRAYIEKEEETMTTNTTIDTSKGGTTNAFIDALTAKGYEVTKADAPNANFQCYNAMITDKSGYNTITIFFGGCDAAHITARVDKVNGTHKWYYGKTIAQMLAVVRQCMEGYDWTKLTKAEAIEAMDDDAEDPSVTLDEFIAKAQEIDNMKEEDTMSNTTKTTQKGLTYEQFQKLAMKHYNHGGDDFVECWDEKMFNDYVNEFGPVTVRKALEMFGFMDEVDTEERKAAEFFSGMSNNTTTNNEEEETMKPEVTNIDTIPTTTENTKEETTMKTTNITMNLTEGVAKFDLNGTTYKYMIDSKRYAKTTPDGKTKRIGKAEYEKAYEDYLHELSLYDPEPVGEEDDGQAEPTVNVQNEQKKPRKARKSKDIAYEGNGVTLTAKQVDFLLDLKQTDQWEGLESKLWTDVICDEIEGQFAGKPMTVGAMISTLCEKGLAERFKGEFTDPVTNRTRKSTYMELTPKGWEIAKELGL